MLVKVESNACGPNFAWFESGRLLIKFLLIFFIPKDVEEFIEVASALVGHQKAQAPMASFLSSK